MFNSPLKPVLINPSRRRKREDRQHPALKKLFNSTNHAGAEETDCTSRLNSLNKYNGNSSNSSLINSIMFNRFILNGSGGRQVSTQTLRDRYSQNCIKHLMESRMVSQLSNISQTRQLEAESMLGEISPRTPNSASSLRKTRYKTGDGKTGLQSRLFQSKSASGMTSMKFIPKTLNGGFNFSNGILLGGDVDGRIQLYKIQDDFCNVGKPIGPMTPTLQFSLPTHSFINRICATSEGGCYVASDDSTLFYYDISQMDMTGVVKPSMTFNEHVNYITDVKANWREYLIASSSLDKTVKIWNNQLSRPIYNINLKEFVHSCCWFPRSDYSLLTSSSKDSIITTQPCSIKWWDIRKLSTYVTEIIQTDNMVDFRSNLAYSLEESENGQLSTNLFGSWNSQEPAFSKQEPEYSFGSETTIEEAYFDGKLQRYIEPFISHCRPQELIFDLHCVENSRNEPILVSTSQLGSKLWSLNGKPKGISTLISKYSSTNMNMDSNIVPAFYGNDMMISACKEGNLYMWNSILSLENSNKKTNYSHKFKKIHPSSVRSLAITDTMMASSDQNGNLSIVSLCDDTNSGGLNMEISNNTSNIMDDLSLNSSFDGSATSLIFDSIFDIIERTRNSQMDFDNLLNSSTATEIDEYQENSTSTPKKSTKRKSASQPSSSKKKKK